MSIITQAGLTALRNLKYGNDQPGGGSSGEPYITTKIPPPYKQQVASTTIWNSDNGLIRGGFTGASVASARDTLRIGKFLVDPPRGPLFIAKQIGLQLSNPQLETKPDIAGQLLGKIGPTRIYNLGINTLAQIPITAFGGHITRHGLYPVLNEGQLYSNVVKANNTPKTNRLVLLKDKLVAAGNNTTVNIKQYVSGPGSIDGIGTTTIRRFDNTLGKPQYNQYGGGRRVLPIDSSSPGFTANLVDTGTARVVSLSNISSKFKRPVPDVDYFLAQGLSEEYFDFNRGLIEQYNNIVSGSFTSPPSQIDQNAINYSAIGKTYGAIRRVIDNQISGSAIGKANITTANTGDVGFGNINNQFQVTQPITFSFRGKSKYNNLPLDEFNIEKRLGLSSARGLLKDSQDQINLTPLFQLVEEAPGTNITIKSSGKTFNVRDLIKFRIESVDGDAPDYSTWMMFRAYITGISDNPNPSWGTVNYVGRGEPFYIYKGFERTISFNFQVAAMSREEMEPMWQKLNYLYSNTMPDYNGTIMRGPYNKLTIGNYMYRQPGIIKSLIYTIEDKSPWEIAIDDPERGIDSVMYELPHVMNVSMTFAPIHDFLPRKFPENYTSGSWANLPAFVVDRDDNYNKWLTNIFVAENEKGDGTIPFGEPAAK